MVFNFYNRLTSRQQSIYRQSDDIKRLTLRDVTQLSKITDELESFLREEDLTQTEARCQLLADEIVRQIKSPRLKVQVLSVRPSDDWGELHGLYLPEDDGQPAKIQVWMRTAKHKKVVAFKSFLRTLLHELCHHLDYEHFGFPETFHTEGFYSRESSLFKQIRS
ncbi:MAG: hypothetical protein HOI07_08255 [Betaproteobacteria bacterium]|nr:hypothetical protein [Betaproteobacteria bacterium]MDG2203425.1 hypothetical protein [Burkholderiales bacterium]